MTTRLEIEQPVINKRELPILIHDLIKGYIIRTTEEKTNKENSQKYWDKREKTCLNAFYRLRACKNREDFLVYFTGTLCSVPQFIREEEYQVIAEYLTGKENWEDVKSLSMLALSKLSYRPKSEQNQEKQSDQDITSQTEEGDE
ncbi:MAG: hypothetical protein K2X01_10520 [Cyanobacteria bacterium]|nr:hypothetical protein [Cyanobacteriota bacterium]